jgi:hypothetical protein
LIGYRDLPLPTLAIEGPESSSIAGDGGRWSLILRYADLGLLALALPVFLVFDLPMLGYVVTAVAWLAQRGIELAADRRAATALAAGERRTALGTIAATTLARVWLVALAVLLVGGLADREDGLAAAVLCVPLITVSLAGRALARLVRGTP